MVDRAELSFAWVTVVAMAACSTSVPSRPAPHAATGQTAAWQTFAKSPFRVEHVGHWRASWAAAVREPPWVAETFANLGIEVFDGASLGGEVSMYAAKGLDPRDCAVEVIWDERGRRGIRLGTLPKLEPAGAFVLATWRFRAEIAPPRPILATYAFVFCPIDDEHRDPPWGASFTTVDTFAAGPGARDAFCATLRAGERSVDTAIAGHRTFDLQFACGVLPRLRGRLLVDECRDDVLLSLDDFGARTVAGAPGEGTPLQESELQRYVGGDTVCSVFTLAADPAFPAGSQAPFEAFARRAGERLQMSSSRDGLNQP